MKIALIGAGSSVGRHMLALDDPRYIGIYRSPKALSQLCDLDTDGRLIRVTSLAELTSAISGCDSIVTLINDENPLNALNSLKEVVQACAKVRTPQLIHLSSAAIYGSLPGRATATDCAGSSVTWNSYGAGKQWQENFLKACRTLPVSTVVLRPGLIWGPGMAWLHAPAGDVLRGDAWVVEGDAPCNLVNINLLIHSILHVAATRPAGLVFANIRDRNTLNWSQYYARLAEVFKVTNFSPTTVGRSNPIPWKSQPGAVRSTFPWGLGWSVMPKPLKNMVKKSVKAIPRRSAMRDIEYKKPGPSFPISREVWELKIADGLPPGCSLLTEIQNSYPRTTEQDWSDLVELGEWMFV